MSRHFRANKYINAIKTLFVNNSLDVRFQDIMQQVLERSKNEEDHDWQKR